MKTRKAAAKSVVAAKRKIGVILECGPQGADEQVFRFLIPQLRHCTEVVSSTLDNKRNLIEECGLHAKQLLQQGCDQVFIIWDLLPSWPDKRSKPCRKVDRASVLESLQSHGLQSDSKVVLLCVERMLESWLLVDECAIEALLSTNAHPVRVTRSSNPEQEADPKSKLIKLFKDKRGRPYVDRQHAIQIIRNVRPARLQNLVGYQRLDAKLLPCHG